jgi:hypothetical protein
MKLDLYARHKKEYAAPRTPAVVTIGAAKYLVAAGRGDPNGPAFGAAVGALYGVGAVMAFARAHGLRPHGRHHEIYLSDPRRAAPARLRTILRHPVR